MKKILLSFVAFCGIVVICRHIVSDIKQAERLSVLENQIANLYLTNSSYEDSTSNFSAETNTLSHESEKKHYIYNNVREKRQARTSNSIQREQNYQRDTLKFSNPITLELNTIDSATLIRVPGIGAKSASMIINYRNRLGGFYSPYQLLEKLNWDGAKERIEDWSKNWFVADRRLSKRIKINNSEFKEILRHPYFNYEQTKAIVNYRDKHKQIESMEIFKMFEEFQEEDHERLKYYINFTK